MWSDVLEYVLTPAIKGTKVLSGEGPDSSSGGNGSGSLSNESLGFCAFARLLISSSSSSSSSDDDDCEGDSYRRFEFIIFYNII